MRLESVAVHDIHRSIEEPGDVILERGVTIDGHAPLGIALDHNVGIAVGAVIVPRPRAEQRGECYATGTQRSLLLPQPGDDVVTIYETTIADGQLQQLGSEPMYFHLPNSRALVQRSLSHARPDLPWASAAC